MIKNLKQDTFLKSYTTYFIGSMIVAVLNYAFHPILGRLMNPSDFGDIQAFISLLAQSAIIFVAFSVVVVNITTNTENSYERNAIISELQKIALWITLGVFIILIISLLKLQSFFNFSSIYPLIALAVILPISAINVFRDAYLQGCGAFMELSISGVISSLGRLFFAVSLLVIGWGTLGVTLGIILSNIAVMAYLYLKTRKTLNLQTKSNIHTLKKGSIKKELTYGVLVFFTTGLVTLFYTIDVLIVKRYFDAHEAGLYSGISAIAKILLFVIGPVSAVLLSSIKIKNSFKENFNIFRKSLGITLFVGFLGLTAFSVFYDLIIKAMIGDRYADLAYLLPKVCLVMILTAFMSIFIFYFLALRRFFLIFISIFGAAVLGFILFQSYTSITEVLNNLLFALVFINLSLVFLYAKDYFNYRSGI
jgi:O-antigen/teichoic acid export membrane protein